MNNKQKLLTATAITGTIVEEKNSPMSVKKKNGSHTLIMS